MERTITPELLDKLSPRDPGALRSRRDLCRLNALIGHHAIMAGALRRCSPGDPGKSILDLGSGDGRFLLTVARRLQAGPALDPGDLHLLEPNPQPNSAWGNSRVMLLDRHSGVAPRTLAAFLALGWRATSINLDVFDWSRTGDDVDLIVTNLFLHHFAASSLLTLMPAIAKHASLFVALEPRRARWPLLCCRLLWAIGCSAVTQHDAVASVHAGFADRELSALWPDTNNWKLTERPAGLFSHLFIAQRTA